jgi:DNA replication protein DnaC
MEPLNDIIGRLTPRRQLTSNQPTHQGTSSPSSKTAQPSTRQQLPEQMAHPRQRNPYSQQQLDRAAIDPRHSQDGSVPRQLNRRSHQESTSYREPDRHQTSSLHARQMQQPTRHMLSRAQQKSLPSQYSQSIQPLLPSDTSKTGHYHHADDSSSKYYGDVIDEWDEEEDVDYEGIRYGDWEDDKPEHVYKRPELEVLSNPRTRHSSYLQETVLPRKVSTIRPTRDLRNIHTDALPGGHTSVEILPSSTQLPHPTVHTQDIQQYQRVTQPLNPRITSRLERERGLRSSDIQHAVTARSVPLSPSRARPLQPQQSQQLSQPSPTAIIPAKSVCPRCRGAGYLRADVPFGDPHFGKAIACECKEAERRAKRRQQLREMSNLDALREQNFQTFNPRVPGVQEAYNATVAFAENPDGWLLLVGPNGCGKTHLAAAIANQALDSGAVVLFEPVPDLLDHLRAAFAPSSNEVYDQLFAKMREAEVLILDDMGAQQSSPWANEKLFQLLNYRYNMGMPTVITANLKGIQGVDERIRSRLSDTALVQTIHMDRAYDYRPKRPKRY